MNILDFVFSKESENESNLSEDDENEVELEEGEESEEESNSDASDDDEDLMENGTESVVIIPFVCHQYLFIHF
jgi:hypothetical protein